MKKPKSTLPWKVDRCFQEKEHKEQCWCAVIEYADNSESGVCSYGSIGKQDAEYIVEAANNYQKAIELLKLLKQDCEALLDDYNRPELNDFLKSIE